MGVFGEACASGTCGCWNWFGIAPIGGGTRIGRTLGDGARDRRAPGVGARLGRTLGDGAGDWRALGCGARLGFTLGDGAWG
jgi:hypothetical protein